MLTPAQWKILNGYYKDCTGLMNEEMSSTVYRSGLIAYRIAMVLTVLRNENSFCSACQMFCSDEDLNTAIALSDIYIAHDLLAYKLLLSVKGKKLDGLKMKFFSSLPDTEEFTRQKALEIAEDLSIKERTVGKYLKEYTENGILESVKFGSYRKK